MDMADLGNSHHSSGLQRNRVIIVFPLAYITACYSHYVGNGGGKNFQGLGELKISFVMPIPVNKDCGPLAEPTTHNEGSININIRGSKMMIGVHHLQVYYSTLVTKMQYENSTKVPIKNV